MSTALSREAVFAGGRGMLGIWVLEKQQIVAVSHVSWRE
jgi:hypothetical protein